MADKYIIEGETYNGDGTTSSAAASAGAAGAWNHINILTGTAVGYGTLAAGDVVYIRSKTAAGADITVTAGGGVNIGSSAGTATAYVTWVLDSGTVWSGIDGLLTFTTSNLSYNFATVNYNRIISEKQDSIVLESTATTAAGQVLLAINNSVMENWKYILPNSTSSVGYKMSFAANVNAEMINPHFVVAKHFNLIQFANQSTIARLTIVNPDIELLAVISYTILTSAFGPGIIYIIGGQIRGAGATTGATIFAAAAGHNPPIIIGMQFPRQMTFCSTTNHGSDATVFGADGEAGAYINRINCVIDSRDDGYYPTLNATLLDSVSTPWSWRMYPHSASLSIPAALVISTMWAGTATTATLTLNIQLTTSFNQKTADNYWAEFIYIDNATGLAKTVSTRTHDASALTSSSASWSAGTWGAIDLDPYEFSVTTPTSIKADSLVTVRFCTVEPSANTDEMIFICPAVQIA